VRIYYQVIFSLWIVNKIGILDSFLDYAKEKMVRIGSILQWAGLANTLIPEMRSLSGSVSFSNSLLLRKARQIFLTNRMENPFDGTRSLLFKSKLVYMMARA